MQEIKYQDFDLLIGRAGQQCIARVLDSPVGQATIKFTSPFSDLEVENFVLRIGRTRRGVRRLESPHMEAARDFGGRLFNTVFGDAVGACLQSSLYEARRQGAGLRIRLRLVDVPELADLPWEYLYNPTLNRFLVLSAGTPIVRYLELPERIRPLTVKPPLRVLAMISSPSGHPPLNVEQEWTKLRESLDSLERRGLVALERLEEAALGALQRRLRRGECHIFHFIGHGSFDEHAQDGVLLLEDEEGRGNPVSGQYLGMLMHDERTLRLAILNACEGARASRSDPFAGTAQSLVQQGIPAVIAMQFEITDKAAITLASEFYAALADGYPVDAALAEGRKAIFAQDNDVEWGNPVLYMRAPDGRIFDIERLSENERRRDHISNLYQEAQIAIAAEDWSVVIEKLQAVLDLDPAHAEAVTRLSQARQQQDLATLYVRGQKHYKAGRWREALAYFRRAHEIGGDYKSVAAMIIAAERQMARGEAAPALTPVPSTLTRWLGKNIPVALVLLLLVGTGGYFVLKNLTSKPSPMVPSLPTAAPAATPTSADALATLPSPTATPTHPFSEMVRVPAGYFIQGSTEDQIDYAYNYCIESELPQHVKALCWSRTSERPHHRVYLDEFHIDKYEVTNARYRQCVDANVCNSPRFTSSNKRAPYFDDPAYADYPVIYVTWNDANTYCQWAGKRLPTEAEWEKAARGEQGSLWPWGNSFSLDRANVRPGGVEPDTSDTVQVGSYPGGASPYGAMDMVGNVTEWVADWYDKGYYDRSPSRNPKGPASGDEDRKKVIRGGSWNSNSYSARAASRAPAPSDEEYFDIGFRCAQ